MDSEGNQFRLFEFPPSRSRSGGEGGGERKEVRWKRIKEREKRKKERDRLKENEGDVKDRREEEKEGRKKESREGREKWGGGGAIRIFPCFSLFLAVFFQVGVSFRVVFF